ncbi:GNAT family N-acetyltransferase [Streptomyces sp. TLI_171]|uniref:GNAT family N-acetyltransferase n=1 Tax=Streptomyces sp. TLI_171 TaxID=1938859 RepID=UPI000C5272BB|nr:GNAT family N-acetyltransferase [Streptomyces sp. TLI_171]RKE23084.1 acetyltransferase (GNAT) family protein [Streptomyces sp. TLI_171]
MSLSVAAVAAAGDAWVWSPPDAEVVAEDAFTMVRLPDYFDFDLSLVSFTPDGPLGPAVDAVLARARAFDVPVLDWQVLIGSPPGLAAELAARGGRVKLTLEILAADLTSGPPPLRAPAGEVALRWATDPATARDAAAIQVTGFGGELPPPERLLAAAARGAKTVPAGAGGTLVALVDGRPAGTGGVEVVNGVARLTGGVVDPQWRGRGIYRALLHARLSYAVTHGATMALVKANPATSGPILRRTGFTSYGPEPVYAVPLR